MKHYSKNQDEAEEYAKKLIELRNGSCKELKLKQEYLAYQLVCISKFKYIVDAHVAKYKKFSNFEDLKQEAYEALVMAIKTYDSNKGSFSWWAGKYIKTKVYRSANAHSTIRFPLKQAKEIKPHKITNMPILADMKISATDGIEVLQTSESIHKAINQLPNKHQMIVNMLFGFNGIEQQSINNITKKLAISRPQFLKTFEEAKILIKEILQQQSSFSFDE
jgi:RNA polymerase sigma factor (sigma-70 family)